MYKLKLNRLFSLPQVDETSKKVWTTKEIWKLDQLGM